MGDQSQSQIIWSDIPNYEGLYQISNTGLVKSFYHNKSKILKPGVDRDGYLLVVLCKNTTHTTHKVHRLVAQAFLPNPDNYPQINHKDENKQNNMVDNLEWCDNKYNNNYGIKNDWNKKAIIQTTLDGNYIQEWECIQAAAHALNINHSHISQCLHGKRKQAYGYCWNLKK